MWAGFEAFSLAIADPSPTPLLLSAEMAGKGLPPPPSPPGNEAQRGPEPTVGLSLSPVSLRLGIRRSATKVSCADTPLQRAREALHGNDVQKATNQSQEIVFAGWSLFPAKILVVTTMILSGLVPDVMFINPPSLIKYLVS
jgi:hypothetical protein